MKHTLSFICIIAVMLSIFGSYTYAESVESQAEPTYVADMVVVKVNRYIDIDKYSDDEPQLFCGVMTKNVAFLSDEITNENAQAFLAENGFLEYVIRPSCYHKPMHAIDYLKKRSEVLDASLLYVPYDPEDDNLLSHDGYSEYQAFAVYFCLKYYAEPFDYQNEAVDFYGIPIRELKYCSYASTPEEINDSLETNGFLSYLLILDPSMSVKDAIAVLEKDEEILWPMPNSVAYNDVDYGTTNLCDVNDSGEIDMMDYVLLKRAFFGTYTFSGNAPVRADINKNDEIDMMDYILLKRVYFGTFEL